MKTLITTIRGIVLFLLIVSIFLIGLSIGSKAGTIWISEDERSKQNCEILNMEYDLCEEYTDQDMSINQKWVKIIGNNK